VTARAVRVCRQSDELHRRSHDIDRKINDGYKRPL
jgi:hypothetical protein